MISLQQNRLVFSFPELHPDATCSIEFQRTLRIPDDNKPHYLPPGLGRFPLEHVEDYADKVPELWNEHGGVLLPMYQAEALWVKFNSPKGYPFAVKIAAGKINAVTGKPWQNELSDSPQDYVVLPDQPWLDGFCVSKGLIRQFVAMPLGEGYTAEEQITGAAEHGGLQIIVYPLKPELYWPNRGQADFDIPKFEACMSTVCSEPMGLAAGGLMRQHLSEDSKGLAAWHKETYSRCFVHLLNSQQWPIVTGKPMPTKPVTVDDYNDAGLPWFDYYNDKTASLNGSSTLAGLDSVGAKMIKKGLPPIDDGIATSPASVVKLSPTKPKVSDGGW